MIAILFSEFVLAVAGISALWLNFSTAGAPANYRNALYVMFVTHIGTAAVLAKGFQGEGLIALPSASLFVAIAVTVYNRTWAWPLAERKAMLATPKFWYTAGLSLLAIVLLILVQL